MRTLIFGETVWLAEGYRVAKTWSGGLDSAEVVWGKEDFKGLRCAEVLLVGNYMKNPRWEAVSKQLDVLTEKCAVIVVVDKDWPCAR